MTVIGSLKRNLAGLLLMVPLPLAAPEHYRWSSYNYHAWGRASTLIQDHDLYVALDRDPAAHRYAYRELFKHQLPEARPHDIRECLVCNFPLGNERFREQIETALGRRVGERKRGRPAVRTGAAPM